MNTTASRASTVFDSASVRKHHRIALSIVGMLAVMSFVTMQVALLTHEFNLKLSALGNEQMQLFQRSGILTRNLLQAAGDTDATADDIERLRDQLRATTRRLIDNHLALVELQATGLVRTDVLKRFYFSEPYALDRKLKAFAHDADFLANAETAELRRGFTTWAPVMLTMASNGSMIRGFDEAMAECARATTQHIVWLKRILWAVVLLTLMTLALEAAFIFRPLVNRLTSEHEKLYRSERELDHLAHHDSLTGLANRARFQAALALAIERSRASGDRFGVVLLDLNDFKLVNDRLGHAAGDALLVETARRLRDALRGTDLVARLGGDEFAFIVGDVHEPNSVVQTARRLKLLLTAPLEHAGEALYPSGSFGCAVFPDHADNADRLLQCADAAMYAVKAAGKAGAEPIGLYDAAAFGPAHADNDPLEQELHQALDRRELEVHYQPKLRLADGMHAGFEALVRWRHPARGLLAPGLFLPIAERLQLMPQLTQAVLDRVADDLARWRDQGFERIGPVAVNMPEAMLSHDLAERAIDAALQRHGLSWPSIAIEITENVFFDRRTAGQMRDAVQSLRLKGVAVAFDDFGTGYASLTHLRSFPFDEIKIDRSFIHDLGSDERCDLIVRALIQLGQGLSKTIVAEGVETEAQEAFLMAQGCTLVQGFRYARPMPFDAASRWLAARSPTLSAAREAAAV